MERRRLRVYVAGPISKGDTVENVWKGIRWGRRMLQDGLAPYVPHLDAYMTLSAATPPTDDSNWKPLLEWDIEWVAASEAFFRIEGESMGADLEMKVARELGIPVFEEFGRFNYDDLLEYARNLDLLGRRVFSG